VPAEWRADPEKRREDGVAVVGIGGVEPFAEHEAVLAQRAVDLVERDGVRRSSGESGTAHCAPPRVEGLAATDGEQRGSDKSRKNVGPGALGYHASSDWQTSGQTRRRMRAACRVPATTSRLRLQPSRQVRVLRLED